MEGTKASPAMPHRSAQSRALQVGGHGGRRGEGPSASTLRVVATIQTRTLEGQRGRGFCVNGNHTRMRLS